MAEPESEAPAPTDPLDLIESQATYDRQTVAYSLGQVRQQLAISTVNWHTSKRLPMVEPDENGRMRKIHPGTIARKIRELQEHVAMLEALLDAGGELPRPTDDEVPDADVEELEVPRPSLIVAGPPIPPDLAG